MSIRRRLALAFLAILSLFALNIAVYSNGIGQRTASFEDFEQAVERRSDTADLQKQVASLADVVRNLHLLAQADPESAYLEPAQVDEKIRQLTGLSQSAKSLALLSTHSADVRPDLADRGPIAETARQLTERFVSLNRVWSHFFQCLAAQTDDDPSVESEEISGVRSGSSVSGVRSGSSGGLPTDEIPTDEIPTVETPTDEISTDEIPGDDLPELSCDEPQLSLANEISILLSRMEAAQSQQVEAARRHFDTVAKVTNSRIQGIFVLSALVAVIVALVFSAQLNRGLSALRGGAQRIGQGDLQHRIPSSGGDELADLALAFNDMSDNLLSARSKVEEAKAAAEEANRAKSTFLANMSHELRTPMNAIIGYSEMLIEEAEEIEQRDFIPDLQRILTASNHLLALINDVLDLSKIEAGKMTLFLEDISVAELIDDVSATIRPLVAKHHNRLELSLAPNLGILRADQTKLRQTLFNLLSNACKFTSDGTIGLQAERYATDQGDRLRFRITDTGIGMNEEQMHRIFEEFTQGDSSTNRKFGGTGLGLSISKQFCELMAGQLTVSSRLGEGTTFTVDLPAVVPDPEAMLAAPPTEPLAHSARSQSEPPRPIELEAAAEPGPADLGPADRDRLRRRRALHRLVSADADGRSGRHHNTVEGRGHLLVVDDEAASRQRLRSLCPARGWSVSEATNGLVALAMLSEDPPDAILLDLAMPQMNGFEFLKELRRHEAVASLPVVVLTDGPLDAGERWELEEQADVILEKDAFDLQSLQRSLEEPASAVASLPRPERP